MGDQDDRDVQIQELERLAKTASSGRRQSIDKQLEDLKVPAPTQSSSNPLLGVEDSIREDDAEVQLGGVAGAPLSPKQQREIEELERLKLSATTKGRRASIDHQIDQMKMLASASHSDLIGIGEAVEEDEDDGNDQAETAAGEGKSEEILELERLAASAKNPGRRKSIDDRILQIQTLEAAAAEDAENPLLGVNDAIVESEGSESGERGVEEKKPTGDSGTEKPPLFEGGETPTRRQTIPNPAQPTPVPVEKPQTHGSGEGISPSNVEPTMMGGGATLKEEKSKKTETVTQSKGAGGGSDDTTATNGSGGGNLPPEAYVREQLEQNAAGNVVVKKRRSCVIS